MPFVVMAKPTDPFKFETHEVDGIRVHVNKSATAKKSGLVIYVEKFLWIKRLEVRGLKI